MLVISFEHKWCRLALPVMGTSLCSYKSHFRTVCWLMLQGLLHRKSGCRGEHHVIGEVTLAWAKAEIHMEIWTQELQNLDLAHMLVLRRLKKRTKLSDSANLSVCYVMFCPMRSRIDLPKQGVWKICQDINSFISQGTIFNECQDEEMIEKH